MDSLNNTINNKIEVNLPPPGKNDGGKNAWLALAGVILAAIIGGVFTNWDKIFPKNVKTPVVDSPRPGKPDVETDTPKSVTKVIPSETKPANRRKPEAPTPKVKSDSDKPPVPNIGPLNEAPCSATQIGGSGNQATVNCQAVIRAPERHLTADERNRMIQLLRGKHYNVHFGYVLNAPDASQYAYELCSAFKDAGTVESCDSIRPMMQTGVQETGIAVLYHGELPTPEQMANPVLPAGMVGDVSQALLVGTPKSIPVRLEPGPNSEENSITIMVALPEK